MGENMKEDILEKFYKKCIELQLLKEKELFEIVKFKDKSNCINVIDFDDTKRKFYERINCGKKEYSKDNPYFSFLEGKSCDALKFIFHKRTIDFIEGKSFLEFIKRNTTIDEQKESDQIKKINIQEKIRNSDMLYLNIVQIQELDITEQQRKELRGIDRNFILLIEKNDELTGNLIPLKKLRKNIQDISMEKTFQRIIKLIDDEEINKGYFISYQRILSDKINERYK